MESLGRFFAVERGERLYITANGRLQGEVRVCEDATSVTARIKRAAGAIIDVQIGGEHYTVESASYRAFVRNQLHLTTEPPTLNDISRDMHIETEAPMMKDLVSKEERDLQTLALMEGVRKNSPLEIQKAIGKGADVNAAVVFFDRDKGFWQEERNMLDINGGAFAPHYIQKMTPLVYSVLQGTDVAPLLLQQGASLDGEGEIYAIKREAVEGTFVTTRYARERLHLCTESDGRVKLISEEVAASKTTRSTRVEGEAAGVAQTDKDFAKRMFPPLRSA